MKASTFALKAAHKIWKQFNCSISWSIALSLGWAEYHAVMKKRYEIISSLKAGIFTFSFEKISTGEERIAIGTLNETLFSYTPKGTKKSKKSSPFNITYWDLEANSFRAFSLLNFLYSIETIPMSKEDEIVFVEFAKLSIKPELVNC